LVVLAYPQPATETVFVSGINGDVLYKVQVLDLSGKLISESQRSEIKSGINVTELKPGIYFLKLFSADKVFSSRFIKQ
jgi:hypothetical protein